jgi:hypothetical protein
MTDATKMDPCDMTAPMSDQTAPLANRPRSESAAHMPLIALLAPFHDRTSAGIKSNLHTSEFRLEQRLPGESWRIQPFRLRVRPQSLRCLSISMRIMPTSHPLIGGRVIQ